MAEVGKTRTTTRKATKTSSRSTGTTTTRTTVAKKPTARLAKYDWDNARTVFVEQAEAMSLKDLAELTGIPYPQVRDKSSKERWPYLRAEHQTTVQRSQTKARIKKLTEQATAFDDQSLAAARLGINLVHGRMAQIGQVFAAQKRTYDAAVDKLRRGLPVDRTELYSAVNYKEINELASALERFQNAGRKALGIQDIHKFEAEVHGTVEHTVDGEIDLSVGAELQKYDGDRLAAVFDVASRLGMQFADILGMKDVVDAEEVDSTEDSPEELENQVPEQPALGS